MSSSTLSRAARTSATTSYCSYWRSLSSSASTSKAAPKLAFPTHANPNPREIFHLPPNSSPEQVKSRYIELVRLYHPDASSARGIPPEEAHVRFQAIGKAYDALRGKSKEVVAEETDKMGWASARAQKARNMATIKRRRDLDVGMDERWKDRFILGAAVLSIGTIMWQVTSMRRQAMRDGMFKPRQPNRAMSPQEEALRREEEKSLSA